MAVTIGLDARSIYARSRRGTGKNLLDAYRVMARLRPEWRFVLYHRGFEGVDPFAEYANVSSAAIDIRGDRWNLWEHLRLPAAARRDGVDLLHCPANSCPWFRATRVVSTVHDLIPLKLSDPTMNGEAQRFRNRVRRCVARSERVIAVSESTKQDLISDLGGDTDRIDVIAWAADSACAPGPLPPMSSASSAPIGHSQSCAPLLVGRREGRAAGVSGKSVSSRSWDAEIFA